MGKLAASAVGGDMVLDNRHAVRSRQNQMLDIVAAQDQQTLTRPDHQGFHNREPLDAGGLGDARHAEAARQKTGAADHRQHQQQGAEITQDIDEFHGAINDDQP
jgi:hypothetical protein